MKKLVMVYAVGALERQPIPNPDASDKQRMFNGFMIRAKLARVDMPRRTLNLILEPEEAHGLALGDKIRITVEDA